MLLDLERWRLQNMTNTLEWWARRLRDYSGQGLFNFVLHQFGVHSISKQWNCYGLGLAKYAANLGPLQIWQARILHYAGPSKPWNQIGEIPWRQRLMLQLGQFYYSRFTPKRTCHFAD